MRRKNESANTTTKSNVIMMNTPVTIEDPAVETPAVVTGDARLYNLAMQNVTEVGSKGMGSVKKFALVPVELLRINDEYQRTETVSMKKVKWLVDNWDENASDPIKVSPHPETCTLDVIDGIHRLTATNLRNQAYVVCEIIDFTNLPLDQRVRAEAELFAGQTKGKNPLSPIERHKANLLLGDPDCVALQKILDKYGLVLNQSRKGHRGGRSKKGKFAAYSGSLRIIRSHGAEVLDNAVDILCNARWNLATDGFSHKNIWAITRIMILHPNYVEEIKAAMIDYLTPMQPLELASMAHSAYPRRKESERMVMYLEDVMAKEIGFEKVYKVKEREEEAILDSMIA